MLQNEIAVLIPAYKPSDELRKVCASMLEAGFLRVIVVDDGGGAEFAPTFDSLPEAVTVLHHEVNKGKGRALKTGLEYIRDALPDCKGVVTCDADGQHLPHDIVETAKELCRHEESTLVLGSRMFDKNVPLRSQFGNTMTRLVFRLASRVKVRDTQTGLRAFGTELIPLFLSLEGERYEFEINMLLYTARAHIPIVEVDIETVYLDEQNSSSHFRAIRDSAIIYGKILKYSASSLICFLIDFVLLFVFKAILGIDAFASLPNELRLFLAAVAARAISSTVNYLLNRELVFRQKGKHSYLKYAALVVGILLVNYAMLWLLSEVGPLPLFWAKLITEVTLYFVSFNVQKYVIFRSR